VADRDFLQLICALRVVFPQIGLTLSTREQPALREALMPLGFTMMSAGSHTEPGGYTNQGADDLHQTVKGRRVDLDQRNADDRATGQFDISDERSPEEIARLLRAHGLEPVWKDWDASIVEAA
jgi:2-iminoacetate synthase